MSKMNYEDFCEKIVEKFMEKTEELAQKGVRLHLGKIGEADAISIHPVSTTEKMVVAPAIFIKKLFSLYCKGMPFEDVFLEAYASIDGTLNASANIAEIFDRQKLEENVTFTLVNTQENKEYLKTVPHRNWHNLSLIYEYRIEGEGSNLYRIPDMVCRYLGITENQLFTWAYANTKRLYSPVIESSYEAADKILEEAGGRDAVSEDIADIADELQDMRQSVPELDQLIISNSLRFHGAACVFYEDVLQKCAERLAGDFYLIFSSIHEFIAMNVEAVDLEVMTDFVRFVNLTRVEPKERLSNQIYHYCCKTRMLTQITDVEESLEFNSDFLQEFMKKEGSLCE